MMRYGEEERRGGDLRCMNIIKVMNFAVSCSGKRGIRVRGAYFNDECVE